MPYKYRLQTDQAVKGWIRGCRNFIEPATAIFVDKPEQLAAVARRINAISLDQLFDLNTNRIRFHANHGVSWEQAANSKLIRLLMAAMALDSEEEDTKALWHLSRGLDLPRATKRAARSLHKRLHSKPPARRKKSRATTDIDLSKLWMILEDDPFIGVLVSHSKRMLDYLTYEPARAARVASTIRRYVERHENDLLTRHLIRIGVNEENLYRVIDMLRYSPLYVDERLTEHAVESQGYPFFVDKVKKFTAGLPVMLRETLLVRAEATLDAFDGHRMFWRRSEYTLDSYRQSFIDAMKVTNEYLSHFDSPIPVERQYMLEMHVYNNINNHKISLRSLRRRLPVEILYWLLDEMTEGEKKSFDIVKAFRLLYSLDDERWSKIESSLLPPNIEAADPAARKLAHNEMDTILRAELWEMIEDPDKYIRATEATRALKRKTLKIQRNVLHAMMQRGFEVTRHLRDIERGIRDAIKDVEDMGELPLKFRNNLIRQKAVDAVRINVSAFHGIPRRVTFYVEANRRLDTLLKGDGDGKRKHDIRLAALNAIAGNTVQYGNLDEILAREVRRLSQ